MLSFAAQVPLGLMSAALGMVSLIRIQLACTHGLTGWVPEQMVSKFPLLSPSTTSLENSLTHQPTCLFIQQVFIVHLLCTGTALGAGDAGVN